MKYSIYQIDSNDPGEDRVVIHQNSSIEVFAIFDGHGGSMAGDLAAEKLVQMIENKKEMLCAHENDPEIISEILSELFMSCDEIILEECRKRSAEASEIAGSSNMVKFAPFKAGCCALVVMIINTMTYVVHVGDSRAILCSSDIPLSKTSDKSDERKSVDVSSVFNQVHFKMNKLRAFTSKSDEEITTSSRPSLDKAYSGRLGVQRGYDVGGDHFNLTCHGLIIQGITLDHTCQVDDEIAVVRYLSKDPEPIRQSENDKRRFGTSAIHRVAGSLAVTRALGDGYLKRGDMSLEPFSRHVPYITCLPTVSYKKLDSTDIALVLASDGFWNFIKLHEVALLISQYMQTSSQASTPVSNEDLAKALAMQCLENAAESIHMDPQALLEMPPGPRRRTMIDDISIIVVLLPGR